MAEKAESSVTIDGEQKLLLDKMATINIEKSETTNIDVHGGTVAIGKGARIIMPQSSIEGLRHVWWKVPKPVSSFTGRVRELELLHQNVMNSALRCCLISDNISAVTGLGGIGKSELAKKYAHEKGPTNFDSNVIWINAEDSSSMANSFTGLAQYLGVDVSGDTKCKDISAIVARVYDYFHDRKALFIFDNAETLVTTKPFLPMVSPSSSLPSIILTSQNQDWGENVTNVGLEMLEEIDAVRLVMDSLKDKVKFKLEESDAKKLCKLLHCFPLALQQAIAYIKKYNRRRKFTIIDYIAAFDKKTTEILDFSIPDNEYTKTVFVTWQVTFDRLKKENNYALIMDILGIVCYLHAENIPFNTFLKFANDDEDILWDALELLEQYCLIRRTKMIELGVDVDESKEVMFNIHRLVQKVMLLRLDPQESKLYLEKALGQMQKLVRGGYSNYKNDKQFAYHAMLVWGSGSRDEELRKTFCYLPVKIVDALLYQGRYSESLEYVEQQHTLMKEKMGEKHHSTLALLFDKARSLHCIGKHNEALTVYQDAIVKYRETLGELHCDTLAAEIDLAFLNIDLERPQVSLEIFEDVYRKKQEAMKNSETKVAGDNVELYSYRDIYTVMYGIGHALQLLGRYLDAENYYELFYEQRRIQDGEDHPRRLHAGNKLAEVMMKQHKFKMAHELLDNIYAMQVKKLGENHPHSMSTLSNIIVCLKAEGKKEEALNLLQGLYERKLKVLGSEHKDTKKTKQMIDETEGELASIDKHSYACSVTQGSSF